MSRRLILGRLTTGEGRAPAMTRTPDSIRAYAARVRAQFAPKNGADRG